MTELDVLRVLVVFSVVVAPLSSCLFYDLPRGWYVAYGLGVVAVTLGLFAWPWFSVLWPAFCVGNGLMYMRGRWSKLLTVNGLAAAVPFAFSVVAATWIVGGTNDLGILGYGPHFSFYAALHGNVLGWMVVGAIAVLSTRHPHQRLYAAAVFVCFASFLFIAFGIDRLALLKPIGVAGLSLAVPGAQLAFLRESWRNNNAAFVATLVSLLALAGTFVLAWQNELSTPSIGAIASIRSMVSVHGLVNALVVGPAFLWAVALTRKGGAEAPPSTVSSA